MEISRLNYKILDLTKKINFTRAFRLIRIIKLFAKLNLEGLFRMVKTVKRSLASIGYVTILLAVFVIVYALTGRQLLSGKLDVTTSRYNYDTLWWSIVSSFRIMTGDDWSVLMYEAMGINPWFCLYYISLFIIGSYVLFSLYLGILLSKFSKSGSKNNKDKDVDVFSKVTAIASAPVIPMVSIVEDIEDQKAPDLIPKLHGITTITKNIESIIFKNEGDDLQLHGVSCFCLDENHPIRTSLVKFIVHPASYCN